MKIKEIIEARNASTKQYAEARKKAVATWLSRDYQQAYHSEPYRQEPFGRTRSY